MVICTVLVSWCLSTSTNGLEKLIWHCYTRWRLGILDKNIQPVCTVTIIKRKNVFFLFSMTDVTHTHTHVTILWKFSVRLRVLVSFCDIFAWLITVWVWPSEANQRSSLICNRPIRDADGSANLSPVSTSMWTQNWFLLATRNPPRLLLLAGWGHKSLLCLGFLMVKPGRITLALVSKEGNQNRLTNYLRHSVSVPPWPWLAGLDESSSLSLSPRRLVPLRQSALLVRCGGRLMVSPLFTVIIFAEFYICADLYGVQKRSEVLKLTIPPFPPFENGC